jgi:peptidoglycan L-alanyl-D-glutamate endopeptidase CwlK
MQADRDLSKLYPAFREKVEAILDQFKPWCAIHFPGHDAALAEGYRSTQRQQELYSQGRTTPGPIVTQKNGTTNPSNHQSCLAADIAFTTPNGLTWDVPESAWQYLQHLAHLEGLTSGSDWKSFKDEPHVEFPTSDHATYDLAKVWKAKQGLP